MIVWGLSFGGVPTLLQKSLADIVKENGDLAQSMFATVFNSAIAAGAASGALLLNNFGPFMPPTSVIALGMLKMLLIIREPRMSKNIYQLR